MIVQIKRQECIDRYPNLPLREFNLKTEEYDFYYPKTFAAYTLTLQSKSFRGHAKLLGEEISNLTSGLAADYLIFLGDMNIPWLKRSHDFKPANEALQYLVDNKVGKRFKGGLQVDIVELPLFIKHLAWLVRSNAVLPYVHFTDPGQTIIGNLCQYGNLHVYTMDEKPDEQFKQIVATTKFENVLDGNCYNKFSKSGKIEGRRIIV